MDANPDAVVSAAAVEEERNNSDTIMSAMATLSSTKLLHLSHLLSTETHRRNQRLAALLSSPTLFSLTLRRLHSLSLSQKTNLLARHLLSSLLPLTHFLYHKPSPPPPTPLLSLRDNDAVSLLLLLCELSHHHPSTLLSPPSSWLSLLRRYFSASLLSLSLSHYHLSPLPSFTSSLHRLALCRRLLSPGLQFEKAAATAAAAATVVGLPSVEGRGGECVVCREEMRGGREVCQLPCGHMFHWSCILPWLEKTNTCPCCRFSLPTDDVFAEIRRLWDSLLAAGSAKTTVSPQFG